MKKLYRYIKRIFIGILILIIFAVITGVVLINIYQEKAERLALNEINKNLEIQIIPGQIDLSLIRNFPFASLRFIDVTTSDSVSAKLFKAKEVSLIFNLFDLLSENYHIRKIELKEAIVNLKILQDGKDNFHILKKTDTAQSNKNFSFDIKKIILNEVTINYLNELAEIDYQVVAKKVHLRGNFRQEDYFLTLKGDFLISHIISANTDYFNQKKIFLDAEIHIDHLHDRYTVEKAKCKIDKNALQAEGYMLYNDSTKYVDVQIKGEDLVLDNLIDNIPQTYKHNLSDVDLKGKTSIRLLVKGSFSGDQLPAVDATFSIKDGQLNYMSSPVALTKLNMAGQFSNGQHKKLSSYKLLIKSFDAKLKAGTIKGMLSINNFSKPYVIVKTVADLELDELQKFIQYKTIKNIKGKCKIDLTFENELPALNKFSANDFISSKTFGSVELKNMCLTLNNDPLTYQINDGNFTFNNNDVIINQACGKIDQSDLALKGCFKNIVPYLFFPDQELQVVADVQSKNINLDELLQSKSTSSDTSYRLAFSDKVNLNLLLNIDHLNFRKFSASSIRGKLKMAEKKLYAKDITLSTMNGTINAQGMIDGASKHVLLIESNAAISKVNIDELFYQFGNFGQTLFVDKNVKGIVTADVSLSLAMSPTLEVDLGSIYSVADVVVEKGELINYAPMKRLSKFLKVDDLSQIKFSELKNHIEIKDRKIIIPNMTVNSSAINIEASGTHHFDNVIDYHIKLLLSELKARKAKKAKKENEEFGVVEDDGLGRTTLFISVTGTVDDPIFKYDKKGVWEKIKSDFKKEKETFKHLFTGKPNSEKNAPLKKSKFKVDWEESDKPLESQKNTSPTIKKKDTAKFDVKWEDE